MSGLLNVSLILIIMLNYAYLWFILIFWLMLVFEHWRLYEQVSFFRILFLVRQYMSSVHLVSSTQVLVFYQWFCLRRPLLGVLCNDSREKNVFDFTDEKTLKFFTLKFLQMRCRVISLWFSRSERSSNSVRWGVFSNDSIWRRNREYECSAIF